MSKKKAIKITTATAIAASAFVAVAPTQSEAATSSVDKAITKATNQMAKAYDTYHKTAKNENKLPKTATIRKEVKLAQEYYAAATKEIAKNGGSKTKKAAFTKKLDTKKKYLNRAEAYLAAINTNLNPAKTTFTTAVEAGKAKNVEKAKTALVKDVDAFKAIVAKIYGPDVRDLLLEKYATPATELSNSVNDELKVYAAYKAIEAGKFADLEETAKNIDSVKAEVEILKGKDTKLAKTLVEVVAKNIKAFEDKQVTTVKEVNAINATTVALTGTGLDKLKAENFSLEGNKVTSYNVNAETGVATLTFENKFESAKEQTVKLTEKVEGEADKVSEIKFTYTVEVKSVEANALTVDNDTASQKLSFKLNGETVDADGEYLKASGYTVEFQATTGVFVGGTTNSSTGELATNLTQDTKFAYKVVISDKDGKEVAESALVEVKVVDKSDVVTSIDKLDVTNGTIKLSSNTVTLGENFAIDNVVGNKADGTKEADITSLVEFSSSNKDVALVDSTGNILPIKAGTTTITVKSGDATKSFTLTIASDARTAKSATLSTSTLKLVENGDNGSVGVVVKDQYGDVFEGLDLSRVTYEYPQVTVNGTATNIVSVTGTTTDAEGKAALTVAPAAAGAGVVKVKVGNNVVASLNVSVSKDTAVASRKLELVDASKDTKLDIYANETPDNEVSFVYNKYNAAGFLLGKESADIATTGQKYTVTVDEATDKDIIDVAVVDGVITVTAKTDVGTANLVIKEGSVTREKLAITVNNSTPTVSEVTLKNADKVITPGTDITASSVLTLKADSGDDIVQNITLSATTSKAVRLDETTGNIYLDTDANGAYDESELVVGTVSITENIAAIAVGTTIATTAGDKGSVVYAVKNASGKVIATTVVDVEVPAAN
ncbi:hypothetical protein MHI18_15975 [Peribacillus sp. FSL H8-0477]|uniref:hypothetical protein n=1 Tax=Peribacillus sp. FSL H8-0477 TaxID=2921388 RepID=UPI0030FBE911